MIQIVSMVQYRVTETLVKVSEKKKNCIKNSMGTQNFILFFIYSVLTKIAVIFIITYR